MCPPLLVFLLTLAFGASLAHGQEPLQSEVVLDGVEVIGERYFTSGDVPREPRVRVINTTAEVRTIVLTGPHIELTLLVGQYAQAYYLQEHAKGSLTETVRSFESYLPAVLPLPHPSWRSRLWMKKQPWFARRLLPVLRSRVRQALA